MSEFNDYLSELYGTPPKTYAELQIMLKQIKRKAVLTAHPKTVKAIELCIISSEMAHEVTLRDVRNAFKT